MRGEIEDIMEYSDEELYEIVVELDSMATELNGNSADFIISIIEDERKRFSQKQREWIIDLKKRYLDKR